MVFLQSCLSLIILWTLTGCSNNQLSSDEQMGKDKSIVAKNTLALTPSPSNLTKADIFTAKESVFENDALGIVLALETEIDSNIIKDALLAGYDGVYVNFICKLGDNKYINSKDFISKKERILPDKNQFVNKRRQCKVKYFFPYNLIGVSEGNHKTILGYTLLGVKYNKNKTANATNSFEINSIDEKVLLQNLYETHVTLPQLYKLKITVQKFKIETKIHDVHNYDFSLGGTGMPDLYWAVWCGSELKYFSPQIKNVARYDKCYTSDTFYCTKDDVVKINFLDYDNGPFNTQDDLIATWQGKFKDLPTKFDTIRHSRLDYAILKVEEVK